MSLRQRFSRRELDRLVLGSVYLLIGKLLARSRLICLPLFGFYFSLANRIPNRIMNYGITKATPLMMTHMGYGTFLFFGVSTYIGVIWIFFCLPELKGRSIESMDDLFSRSLWTMWRHAYPTEEEKVRHGVQNDSSKQVAYADEENVSTKNNEIVHVEKRVV